ncbi:unnamed protein product [Linum trigynum]|uniref:Uncharacterized protein n=1 Tax=Linum trigynum TaxID=586398 RepID=A0AAV2G0U0_9ROSI
MSLHRRHRRCRRLSLQPSLPLFSRQQIYFLSLPPPPSRSSFPLSIVADAVEISSPSPPSLPPPTSFSPRCCFSLSLLWPAMATQKRMTGGKIAISFPSLHRRRRRRDRRLSLSLSHPPPLRSVSSAMALSLYITKKGK